MILYLVRHGAAESAEGRCIGHTDLALAVAGVEAVDRLAASWPDPPPSIVASPSARVRDTAARLASVWSREVETDERLREMHFGAWDGRTWAELEADDGERLMAWMGDWVNARAPDGESFTDVATRAEAFARDLPRDRDAVVVAHAGSIRALLCTLLALPLDAAFRFRIDHARVSAVKLGSRGAELLFLNADHVPAP